MKLDFFKRFPSEQALVIRETAARRGAQSVMAEKDFWVSWTLAVLFAHPEFGAQLVFKGGTSLSKVFGVIQRFSEDIDLSVSPAYLGISEEWVEQADSRNKRTERMKELEDAWVAEEFPRQLEDFQCNLVALELERTFWEKATILHSEHHREKAKPIRDRFSRHYSDMAALARHATAESALARDDLRQRVANWKSQFFAAKWARYELARPGTFRLAPPDFRLSELEKDYYAMRDMFLTAPPAFENILETVRDLENRINRNA